MDRQTAIAIQSEISAAIKPILAKHKLEESKHRTTYTSSDFKFTVTAVEAGVASTFKHNALQRAGVQIGQEFQFLNKIYKTVEVKQGRGVTWIHAARQPDGKVFRIKSSDLQSNLDLSGGIKLKPKRTESEIIEELRNIEAELSPENLSCDGELSRSQVQQRYSKLKGQQTLCYAELGRIPSDAELYENLNF